MLTLSKMPHPQGQPPLATSEEAPSLTALTPAYLSLLIVDDDAIIRRACAEIASLRGFTVRTASSVVTALSALKQSPADVLLLDVHLNGESGLTLLKKIHALYPKTMILMMSGVGTINSAVEAMRSGASDFITKPFSLDELSATLGRCVQKIAIDRQSHELHERLRAGKGIGQIAALSPAVEKLYRILSKVATTAHPVLILGEFGTGKELIARSIHSNGPNAHKPFIPVDCGSLVPALLESELFGHVQGAFAGATQDKTGLLASAEGGTVFFNEVEKLPLDLQSRLLRALQEREVRAIGGTHTTPLAARVLAATSRDLEHMVATGRFRKDLFFRLSVVNLRIPPLRERKADIPLLAGHIVGRLRRENDTACTFADNALHMMMEYDWPGNIRELEQAIERACALSSSSVLHFNDFPMQLRNQHNLREQQRQLKPKNNTLSVTESTHNITSIADIERQAIISTIQQFQGDKIMAARLLGIGKTTLYRKLKEYGFGKDQPLNQQIGYSSRKGDSRTRTGTPGSHWSEYAVPVAREVSVDAG